MKVLDNKSPNQSLQPIAATSAAPGELFVEPVEKVFFPLKMLESQASIHYKSFVPDVLQIHP